MTRSIDSSHVSNLIPDYVLGLLPGDQADWVTAHTAHCAPCRQALAQEQKISRSVKASLARATSPDRDRLQRLMPAAPGPRVAGIGWRRLSPGLAAASVVLVLLIGAVALFVGQQPGAWGLTAPTAQATAVLLTDTPTQTATREMTATVQGRQALTSPAPAAQAAEAGQAVVPVPAMVPVPAAPVLH